MPFRQMFELHCSVMLLVDPQARVIVDANPAAANFYGYALESLRGMSVDYINVQSEEEIAPLRYSALSGERNQFILDHRLASGDIRTVEAYISVIEFKNKPHFFTIIQDITERNRAEAQIHKLAFYDVLTGLPNRRLLIDRLRLALLSSARSHHYGAVLFLDLDRFKIINDTLGHDQGDQLLIEVAKRIRTFVREMDTVARLGGDEFVVLLGEVDEKSEVASQKTSRIAEKLRISLSQPYHLKGYELISSSSIGIVMFQGDDKSAEDLLKYADMAMYQVKEFGRNAVRFFDPSMQLAVETHAKLESDLRYALLGQQLHLYYQIQVGSDHRPIGAEALIRWIHPIRGMVSPMQFIPIAEESNLIIDIGDWVLDTACQQLKAWAHDELTHNLIIAVNVSAQQFKQSDFVDKVAAVLRTHQVEPTRLKLELTESVVLNNINGVIVKMHALKALGVSLSMDDFGTGYSSLSYLKHLPLDQIKIDMSFVRDMLSNPNDAIMVKTIIDMAHNFNLNVIAEGVETAEQMKSLKQMNCLDYQGYYFSKPVPVAQLDSLLNSSPRASSRFGHGDV